MYSNSILIHSVIVRKINDASMNLQARHFFMRRQNHEKNSPNNEFLSLGNLHCPSNDLLFWIWNFFFYYYYSSYLGFFLRETDTNHFCCLMSDSFVTDFHSSMGSPVNHVVKILDIFGPLPPRGHFY